jgi:hypothetical protein
MVAPLCSRRTGLETHAIRYNTDMDEPELTAYVIEHLGRQDDIDDLTLELCKQTGWGWQQAADFIGAVEAGNRPVIAKRQFPLLFALAFVLFAAGAGLIGYGVYGFYLTFSGQGGTPSDLTTYFMPVIQKGADPLEAMQPAISPYVRFFLYFWFGPVPALIFGGSMVAGSLLGMKRVWSAILSG